MENWKDIEGFEGLYKISDWGRVWSYIKNRMLKTSKGYPYVQITLTKNRTHYYFLLNRLVWETFVGKIPDGFQINHNDENKNNNALSNLSLMTPSQNINYGTRNQKVSKKMKGVKPSESAINKSKELFSQQIDQINTQTGEIISSFYSMMEAERCTNTKSGNISKCCNGKCKTANGYIWRKPL